MTKYEIMYIIRPTVSEDERKALIDSLHSVFTNGNSEIRKVDEWGTRDLAYEIQKHRKGYYVVLDVTATEEDRAEFDRIIRLKENILRYLILKDVR
jgi:small subunit ribosomal protein S6